MATDIWIDTSQRLQVLLNRAASSNYELRLANFPFSDDLSLLLRNVECRVSVETLINTQLIRLTASLLRRVLVQQQFNNVGWESATYCSMVAKAADIFIFAGTGFQHSDAALLAFAAQVHKSKLVPDLSTALSTLAQITDAAGGCDPAVSADAAGSLLAAVEHLVHLWPGDLGALVSATAGPLLQPALQFAAAKVRNALKAAPTSSQMHLDTLSRLFDRLGYQMSLQYHKHAKQPLEQCQQQQQRHPYSSQLQKSPDFLQLQLFLIALNLQRCYNMKVLGHSSVLAPGTASHSVPAHGRTADATATAASSSAADPAQHVCDIHQSNQAVAGPPAAPLTDYQAVQCQKLEIEMLQALYPSTQGTTSWETLLAAAAQAGLGVRYLDPLDSLLINMSVIAISVSHLHDSLSVDAGPDSPDANDSSNEESLAAVHLNNLKALQVLPVLLLRSLQHIAPPGASAAGFRELCGAARYLLRSVTACWSCQTVLHHRGHAAGVDIQQLPLAELLDLLLQHVKPLLQHLAAAGADGALPPLPVHTAVATAESGVSTDVTTVRDVGSSSGSDGSMQDEHTEAATAPETAAAAAAATWAANVDASIKELLLVVDDMRCVCDTSAHSQEMLLPSLKQLTAVLEQYIRNSSSRSSRPSSSVDIEFVHMCAHLLDSPFSTDTQHPPDHRGLLVLAAAAAEPDSNQQHRLFALLISLLKGASDLSTLPADSSQYFGLEPKLLRAVGAAASHMLNTVAGSGNGVVGTSYGPSNAADNAATAMPAAAPWLVAVARVLINTAGMFGRAPELDHEESPLEVPDNRTAGRRHQLSKCYEAWHNLVSFTQDVASAVISDIGRCCQESGGPTSSSSSLSDHAAAGVGTAAATGHTITDAVYQLQVTELAAAAEQLGAVCQRLRGLHDACFGACCKAHDTTPDSDMRPADLEPAAAAEGQTLAVSTCDITQLRHRLQQWGIQSLQQELCEVGQRVCAALPLRFCCNNPSCSSMKDDSELTPVNGKSCVCAGCEVARYCCVDCQAAHWQQHKPICKLIKRQNKIKQQQQHAV